MDLLVERIQDEAGFECFDAVAGGETAGIPFAAWIAERMGLPMLYVRKKAKGFGRNAQIEGDFKDGDRVLLIEDLATDGGSKLVFVDALREAGAVCAHTAVVFHYGIFPEGLKKLTDSGVTLHALCTWWDALAVAEEQDYLTQEGINSVRAFLSDPEGWSRQHGGEEKDA